MEATILIVTDHTGGPAGTEELARSRRFRLAGRVPSLARAVEHAQGGQVDVLVVEVSTPERLREVATGLGLPPGTKVIVLSGLAAETTLLPVMAAGVQGFVRRPVPDGLLSAAVGAVLNGGAFVDPRSTKWLVSVALRGPRRDPEDG
jgi:DNA-binding NarL/FixJ family response regulator